MLLLCGAPGAIYGQSASADPTREYGGEPFVVETSRTVWRFEVNGTGQKDTAARVKIQSEAGVQRYGQLVFGYNAANERLEIGGVHVIKADGTRVSASGDAVQDLSSAVERVAPVYTDAREKHVTVPSLRPGDVLEFSVRTTIHTPLAPGQFWMEHEFAKSGIVLDEELEVDVPADRRLILKTRPGADPQIAEVNGRRVYTWRTARLSNEIDSKKGKESQPKTPEYAAVRLTTFSSWAAVGEWYAALERTQKAPTPDITRKAAELTTGRTTDVDKVEALYDYVSGQFRYVSLSFGVGRYQPHAASEVLRNQYGDCKDKHTLLASLIDATGLQASAALVNSQREIDPSFPSPSQFNHVITRVAVGSEPIWLDATVGVAPFQLLLPTVRNTYALVVDGDGGTLLKTPADSRVEQSADVRIDGSLNESGLLSAHVHLAVKGDLELALRLMFRQLPRSDWKKMVDGLSRQAGLEGDVTDWTVSDPDAMHTPFSVDYRAQTANYVRWTTKQFDLRFPFAQIVSVPSPSDDAEPTSIELGPTRQITYAIRLELPSTYAPTLPLPVSLTHDYGDYRAEYRLEGSVLSAKRQLTVRGPELPASRGADYAAFRRVVSHDVDQTVAVEGSLASAATAPANMSATELFESGRDAIDAHRYAQAIVLMKRVAELDPAHKNVWNNLGYAYLELNQLDEAIGALRKQIAINPYDGYAYRYLGRAYGAQRQFEDAEAAYHRQLDIDPLNLYAHSELGELYFRWRRYEAGLSEIEKAIALSPKDATLRIRLGEGYLHVHEPDRAMQAFERAVELRPDARSWNEIAYQLALTHTALDLAQRYAESAVASTTLATTNIAIEHVTPMDLWQIGSLAAHWDTLGWVYFSQGDVHRAETFVRASWILIQNAEVGDHLAQIYEKLGRREDAIRMYALALNTEGPDEKTRERLTTLVGDTSRVDRLVGTYRGELVRERTIVLDHAGPVDATADFFLVFSHGSIESVKFITGDRSLLPLGDILRGAHYDVPFPDGSAAKIVRRGTVSCSSDAHTGSCRLVMLLPQDAQMAQQE
jgi:tetratricopeptide (TPR) repeat protein/transglutaminase-like putative cysteine protease